MSQLQSQGGGAQRAGQKPPEASKTGLLYSLSRSRLVKGPAHWDPAHATKRQAGSLNDKTKATRKPRSQHLRRPPPVANSVAPEEFRARVACLFYTLLKFVLDILLISCLWAHARRPPKGIPTVSRGSAGRVGRGANLQTNTPF